MTPEEWAILDRQIAFPHPTLNVEEDLLCIGGDLSSERLKLAYQFGLFPWSEDGHPIHWYSPRLRPVIFPERIKCAKSMRPYFNQQRYHWTYNQCFAHVMRQCGHVDQRASEGSWIYEELIQAYVMLHQEGAAASVETWCGPRLVGGLYGVWVGQVFCGESMFSLADNASKFALIAFTRYFHSRGRLALIDCQMPNPHLMRLGAEMMDRKTYLQHLRHWGWKDIVAA